MKKTIIFLTLSVFSLMLNAQNFTLNYKSVENLLTDKLDLATMEQRLKPNYLNVKKGEKEWKFRDDNKSWEAILSILFDSGSKKIKEIQFVAPKSRIIEYTDELKNELGYSYVRTENNIMDIYLNSEKKLEARTIPLDGMGLGLEGMVLYRLLWKE